MTGVSVCVRSGSVTPASFNRRFFEGEDNKLDEENLNMLLLGPSIVPRSEALTLKLLQCVRFISIRHPFFRPERLKKMIKQLEDKGYSGPECRSVA